MNKVEQPQTGLQSLDSVVHTLGDFLLFQQSPFLAFSSSN